MTEINYSNLEKLLLYGEGALLIKNFSQNSSDKTILWFFLHSRVLPLMKIKLKSLRLVFLILFYVFNFLIISIEGGEKKILYKIDCFCDEVMMRIRPKTLQNISKYPEEKEYLLNCFSLL
jgi:hypothetical protein